MSRSKKQIKKITRQRILKNNHKKQKRKLNSLQIQARRSPKLIGSFLFIFVVLMIIIFLPSVIVQIPEEKNKKIVASSTDLESEEVSKYYTFPLPNIEISVHRTKSDDIEKMSLENYVRSVIAAEMPAHFELEALKAQAIAARTYIVNHLLREGKDAIITDTIEHQVYYNEEELKRIWGEEFFWKWDKMNKAVEETEDTIIVYNDEPITPTFFSMSNGYTEDAKYYWGQDLPYLKSVESKWEKELPDFTEQKIFTKEELYEKLEINMHHSVEESLQIKRTPSERVHQFTIGGETLSGKEVREKLALRSSDFTVKQQKDHFIFTTKGYGHGVGMSQHGANFLALEGKSYEDILTYYYQHVELRKINQLDPNLIALLDYKSN